MLLESVTIPLSIILSNFHAFKNRKFMMKFLVGLCEQRHMLRDGTPGWHCTERQCSDHWHYLQPESGCPYYACMHA